uniref:Ig-like domain-containing protein n=1 Tax=Syphacia muris TaxID=451379 RepID=A0A0N5AE24_9BILA
MAFEKHLELILAVVYLPNNAKCIVDWLQKVTVSFKVHISVAHIFRKRVINTEAGNRLVVQPATKEDRYAARKGEQLSVVCVYNHSSDDLNSLVWRNVVTNKVIDEESSSRVFTVSVRQHHTHFQQLTLIFLKLNADDEGNYVCEAENFDGVTYTKTINVIPLETLEWGLKDSTVGGLVDEKVIINCSATGDPRPHIIITDANGKPLSGADFIVDGNLIYIPRLTTEYNGRQIRCSGTQVFEGYDQSDTETKLITIEVYYPPQFLRSDVIQYAIVGRNVTVECQVNSSNPPVNEFNFFRGDNQIFDIPGKYDISVDLDKQLALFTIIDLKEEDLGSYACAAINNKSQSEQTIELRKADPPGEVKVSYENAKENSIVLKIQQAEDEQLPIINYIVRYIQQDQLINAEPDSKETLWNEFGKKTAIHTNENGLYEIGQLLNNTKYVFRISAQSAAGVGGEFELGASTTSIKIVRDVQKSATRTLYSWVPIVVLFLLH